MLLWGTLGAITLVEAPFFYIIGRANVNHKANQHYSVALEEYARENFTRLKLEEGMPGVDDSHPKLQFTGLGRSTNHNRYGACGLYNRDKGTITINLECAANAEQGLLAKLKREISDDSRANLEGTIRHELAHSHNQGNIDRLMNEIPLAYFKDPDALDIDSALFRAISIQLLNEGIATYKGGLSVDRHGYVNFDESVSFGINSFLPLDPLENRIYYTLGFGLVKPIIDRYGQDGINYLWKNPPTPKDLMRPFSYQQRMLDELAGISPVQSHPISK